MPDLAPNKIRSLFSLDGKAAIVTGGAGALGQAIREALAAYGSEHLATEWAKRKITVNSIAPTIFWTPRTRRVLEDKKLKKISLDRIPLGRAVVPEDMAGASVYLASAAPDFITGQILYADGGCTSGLRSGA